MIYKPPIGILKVSKHEHPKIEILSFSRPRHTNKIAFMNVQFQAKDYKRNEFSFPLIVYAFQIQVKPLRGYPDFPQMNRISSGALHSFPGIIHSGTHK